MRKLKHWLYQFVKWEGMTFLIAILAFVSCMLCCESLGITKESLIDWSMFSSMLLAMVVAGITRTFNKWLMNILEDEIKLTTAYSKLAAQYNNPMVSYCNQSAAPKNRRRLRKSEKGTCVIPAIYDYKLRNCQIKIADNTKRYECPKILQDNMTRLFSAHDTSNIYNRLSIRADAWQLVDNILTIHTSRTTFFDSLITNRIMDFQWANQLTVRKLFEFGSSVHSLKESVLSNHLGCNGFVESDNEEILFVKRRGNLSIGKRTYGNSVGASLKLDDNFNDKDEFTTTMLKGAILLTIEKELGISQEDLEEFSFENNMIAAYRDLVEGGKPQLLFYVRSTKSTTDIKNMLRNKKQEQNARQEKDGSKLLWIPRDELKNICVLPDRIIHNGRAYPMMPAASASVAMLIEYLEEQKKV